MKKPERMDKYWICDECAAKRGWRIPADACNTVIYGLCGHCDDTEIVVLIPTRDFKGKNKTPVFD